MITKTIRITEQQAEFLLESFENVNKGVSACIDKVRFPDEQSEVLRYIRMYSRKELKGKFTKEEWYFFFDSLNGSITEGMFRCNAGALVAHCEDAEQFEHTATRHNVNLPGLIKAIEKLTGAQVDALYTYVEEFWNDESRNLEKAATELV